MTGSAQYWRLKTDERDRARRAARGRAPGFSVMPQLGGHGVVRTIRADPLVPKNHNPSGNQLLGPGLVIVVEPMIYPGSGRSERKGSLLPKIRGQAGVPIQRIIPHWILGNRNGSSI